MASFQKQKRVFAAWLVLLSILAFSASPASARSAEPLRQGDNQTQQGPSPFRVVKVEMGSKGVQKGKKFAVEDLRTVFHFPADKQVVIQFVWDGPPGTHQFKGTWRDSLGRVENVSNFEYTTTLTQYTGYWVLEFPPNPAPGLWVLEAQIDGQPAGVQTFEVTVPPAAAPQLTTGQVYALALASTVTIAALNGKNEVFRTSSGFFIRPNVVLTSFGAINGSNSLQIGLPDGSSVGADKVLAWNYDQDWVMLSVAGKNVTPLKSASPNSWKVGDRCYVLDTPSPGSHTIESVAISGVVNAGTGNEQFTMPWTTGQSAIGSPVLDIHGHVIGMLQDRLASKVGYIPENNGNGFPLPTTGPKAMPISLIQTAGKTATPVTLADLAAKGLFVPPLVRNSQISFGVVCRGFRKSFGHILPDDVTNDFYRGQGNLGVVVTWSPTEKLKTTEHLSVYDLKNRPVAESKLKKIELKPHDTTYTAWSISTAGLEPGNYRVDVFLGNTPEWRGYFRIHQ